MTRSHDYEILLEFETDFGWLTIECENGEHCHLLKAVGPMLLEFGGTAEEICRYLTPWIVAESRFARTFPDIYLD